MLFLSTHPYMPPPPHTYIQLKTNKFSMNLEERRILQNYFLIHWKHLFQIPVTVKVKGELWKMLRKLELISAVFVKNNSTTKVK